MTEYFLIFNKGAMTWPFCVFCSVAIVSIGVTAMVIVSGKFKTQRETCKDAIALAEIEKQKCSIECTAEVELAKQKNKQSDYWELNTKLNNLETKVNKLS